MAANHSEVVILLKAVITVKPVLSGHSKRRPKLVFKANSRLMQVKVLQNAPREHSAILLTFIKLPFVFKTFVLSIFEWPLKADFTVVQCLMLLPQCVGGFVFNPCFIIYIFVSFLVWQSSLCLRQSLLLYFKCIS